MPKADAVFEGGGVKGIGLVGALSEVEDRGYNDWQCVAGTSVGAIVASLVAADYSSEEIEDFMYELDYAELVDITSVKSFFSRIVPSLNNILQTFGVNDSTLIKDWLESKLEDQNIETFGDLRTESELEQYRYELNVIISDISKKRMVVLPNDAEKYGKEPDDLPVAQTVELSLLFPGFFQPIQFGNSYVVDGGLLSNFPVWLFDKRGEKRGTEKYYTFGFQINEAEQEISGPISYISALLTTMLKAHDKERQDEINSLRTIKIPSLGVSPMNFNISRDKQESLFESGRQAAENFFDSEEFKKYPDLFKT